MPTECKDDVVGESDEIYEGVCGSIFDDGGYVKLEAAGKNEEGGRLGKVEVTGG